MPHVRTNGIDTNETFVRYQLVTHAFNQTIQNFTLSGGQINVGGLLLHKLILEHPQNLRSNRWR